jgi:hypothetical protein
MLFFASADGAYFSRSQIVSPFITSMARVTEPASDTKNLSSMFPGQLDSDRSQRPAIIAPGVSEVFAVGVGATGQDHVAAVRVQLDAPDQLLGVRSAFTTH